MKNDFGIWYNREQRHETCQKEESERVKERGSCKSGKFRDQENFERKKEKWSWKLEKSQAKFLKLTSILNVGKI